MNTPRVYIIVLNYKRWQDTLECMNSVMRSTYTNYSLIIIDNDSQNNSFENIINKAKSDFIQKAGSRIYSKEMPISDLDIKNLSRLIFLQNDRNAGFAGGNNIVLQLLADVDAYVWLLNPDMVIQENTLSELVNFAERQTGHCVIGADTRSYSGNQGPFFYGGGKVNFLSGTIQLVKDSRYVNRLDYISGGCLFTHVSNFGKYGLLPEEYFLYWEETDWCFRAKQQGVELLVCPTAICYDKISTVIGKGFKSDYYYSRNGLLFISKFKKRNIPIALFAMKVRWLKRIITGQWGRARGIWRGTIDFLKRNFNEAK